MLHGLTKQTSTIARRTRDPEATSRFRVFFFFQESQAPLSAMSSLVLALGASTFIASVVAAIDEWLLHRFFTRRCTDEPAKLPASCSTPAPLVTEAEGYS